MLAATDPVADVIAVVAIAVSAFALLRASSRDRRIEALEKDRRAEEVERRREEVSARTAASPSMRFEREPVRGSPTGERHSLVLTNGGPATAAKFNIEFVKDDPSVLFAHAAKDEMLPVDLLPGQEYKIQVLDASDTPAVVELLMTWEDDRGPQERPFRLSVA